MEYKIKMEPVVVTALTEEEAVEKFRVMIEEDESWNELFNAYSRIDNGDEYFYDTCHIDTPVGRLETWADKETGVVGIQLVPNPETGDPVNIAMAECNEYYPKDVKVHVFEDVKDEDATHSFTINGEEAKEVATYYYDREEDF